MGIIKHKQIHAVNGQVISMNEIQIEYTEKDVDLNKIKEMAQASSRSIQKDYDEWEREAIENHDEYYIRNELRKISTFELIKELLKRCYK